MLLLLNQDKVSSNSILFCLQTKVTEITQILCRDLNIAGTLVVVWQRYSAIYIVVIIIFIIISQTKSTPKIIKFNISTNNAD